MNFCIDLISSFDWFVMAENQHQYSKKANINKLLKLEHAPAGRFMFDLQNVFIWRKLKFVLDPALLEWK